jgi:hypothetical protein
MKKIYQINMMSGQKIPLESVEDLDKLIEASAQGAKLVKTKYGVINLASIDSIVVHKEMMSEIKLQMTYGIGEEKARGEVLGVGIFEEQKLLK